MAVPRSKTVDESVSGLYHCLSRCVRRGYLLAPGPDGAVADDHRRDWMVARLRLLTSSFAIDCVSLAVMSNHFHVLLRTLPEVVDHWSDAEVAYRWIMVRPPVKVRKRLGIPADAPPQPEEVLRLLANPFEIAGRRERLSSLSWFMKELKEPIARRANKEDDVKGAFWESRFRCYRVLDEVGIQVCATYIDLNPCKAGMASDPMLASHTSIAEHARRLGKSLWREVAEAPDWRGRREPARSLEAFVATFDEAMFEPAMPARREAYGTGDEVLREAVAAAAAVEAPDRSPGLGDASAREAARAAARIATAPGHRSSQPPPSARRTPPPTALLPITLGAYLRRLRDVAEAMGKARDPGGGGTGPDGDLDGDVETALELVREPHPNGAAVAALAAALGRARLHGTAIGTAASLAAEAARRGATRALLALRSGAPVGARASG
ncbi:MAG: hypothetical protein KDA22_09825 [Phycisphaerales bacterium]|nr:hypothetical protein [Phycisphaerales bacterium]